MIRPLTPADILSLINLQIESPLSEARPKRFLSSKTSPSVNIASLWFGTLFAPMTHTWIATHAMRIRSLASIQRRHGPTVWDVSNLVVADHECHDSCAELLIRLGELAASVEATKLFLRLDDSSKLLKIAEENDFTPYQTEVLYTYNAPEKAVASEIEGLRLKADADLHGVYRLYHTSVPPQVRMVEGIALDDWLDCREHLNDENSAKEFVLEIDGEVKGWIKVCTNSTSAFLEMIAPPQTLDISKRLIDFALSKVGQGVHISTLVPEYSTSVATSLENAGFKTGHRMVSLHRPVAVPVKEINAVPVGA